VEILPIFQTFNVIGIIFFPYKCPFFSKNIFIKSKHWFLIARSKFHNYQCTHCTSHIMFLVAIIINKILFNICTTFYKTNRVLQFCRRLWRRQCFKLVDHYIKGRTKTHRWVQGARRKIKRLIIFLFPFFAFDKQIISAATPTSLYKQTPK
jgi:hypothetical protein